MVVTINELNADLLVIALRLKLVEPSPASGGVRGSASNFNLASSLPTALQTVSVNKAASTSTRPAPVVGKIKISFALPTLQQNKYEVLALNEICPEEHFIVSYPGPAVNSTTGVELQTGTIVEEQPLTVQEAEATALGLTDQLTAKNIVLRLTFLTTRAVRQALNLLKVVARASTPTTVYLNEHIYEIAEVIKPSRSGTAASSWRELLNKGPDAGSGRGEAIQFRCITPLVFNTDWQVSAARKNTYKGLARFPDPAELLAWLSQQWALLGGPKLPADLEQCWTLANCKILDYTLKTKSVTTPDGLTPGFSGWLAFKFYQLKQPQLAACQALARLAFFTGLGSYTQVGLGQVQVRVFE